MADSVPWYPDGYRAWHDDDNLAYKWVHDIDCNLGDKCSHIRVLTAENCKSLYAQANFLDSSGSVVDWSNDTANYLSPGSSATLEFSSYDDYVASIQLTELTCHSY